MSRTRKEDLSDPDVIAAFAQRVGSERYLPALYLPTRADLRGTSPMVWNAWKGKLLEDLYRLTLRTLGGHAPDPHAEIEARKREALVQLGLYALPFEAHKKLWDTLDVGYFMRHEAGDIVWHTRHLSRHVGKAKAVVRARLSPVGEGLQVLVYTPDQADLFARIAVASTGRLLDAKITPPTTATRSTPSGRHRCCPNNPRADSMVESELQHTTRKRARCRRQPRPVAGSKADRAAGRLAPDEKAQRWL